MKLKTILSKLKNKPVDIDNNIEIELGASYTDRITKFKGIATGYCVNIGERDQVCLTPEVKDSKIYYGAWFEIQRVVKDDTPGFDAPPPCR
jgi:hypothetical protein